MIILLCFGLTTASAQEDFSLYKEVSKQINAYHDMITKCIAKSEYDQAKAYIDEAQKLTSNLKEEYRARLVAALEDRRASVEAQLGHYDEAINIQLKVLDYYTGVSGLPKQYMAVACSNLAAYYASRAYPGDLDKAISYVEKQTKYIPKNTQDYVLSLYSLSSYYARKGLIAKSQEVGKKAKKLSKSVFKKNPILMAHVLSDNAVSAARAHDFPTAIAYAMQSRELYEEYNSCESVEYCKLLLNLATFYSHQEQYREAVSVLEVAHPIIKQLEGESSSDYLRCMSNLTAAHKHLGNIDQADEYAQVAEEKVSQIGAVNVAAGDARAKLAATYAENGDHQRAIQLEWEAINVYRQLGDSLRVAMAYIAQSDYYNGVHDYARARSLCEQSIAIYDSQPDIIAQKALALNSLSMVDFYEGKLSEALGHATQAMQICEQNADTLSTHFAKICSNLGLYSYYSEQYAEAVKLTQRALRTHCEVLGDEHPGNVDFYHNLAVYNYMAHDAEGVQKYLHLGLDRQMSIVRSNFTIMSAANRERYWNAHKGIFSIAPELVAMPNVPDTLAVDVYNSLLFTKGILLNSEIDFRSFLSKSASLEIQSKYEQLAVLQAQIETASSSPDEEVRAQIPALRRQAENLERTVVKGCKEFGDFTEGMSITVEDIGKALDDHQVAMELFEVDVVNVGTTYMAMYLCKGWKVPRVVRLFSQRDLAEHYSGKSLRQLLSTREGIEQVFIDSLIGNLVWKPLMKEWKNVSEVYFSPTGIFYQWGVEYLNLGNERVCDRYKFHRLSSTKLLAQNRQSKQLDHVALFGGVKYDIPVEEMMAVRDYYVSGKYKEEDDFADLLAPLEEEGEDGDAGSSANLLAMANDAVRGASLTYLPGTLEEVVSISERCAMQGISADIYEGAQASEEAFYLLSGSDVDLLHIATHGFSVTPPAGAADDLNYSGLVLSGATNAFKQVALPKELANGILTANEISKLDLRNLDLVVLSACQTGLGEVREDGVFGLQRGFKKAGAHTLMMSLWSVSDAATSAMMRAFYEGLITRRLSRSEAFSSAITALQQQGYTSPYYWASFILLDDY